MESFFNCCGMCVHMNLYDKYAGKFKCTKWDRYAKPTDQKCSKYEGDGKRTYQDIEKAR